MKNQFILFLFLLFIPSAVFTEKKFEVFFTSPAKHAKNDPLNPQNGLISAIRNCGKSFYGAFYDISSKRIADELIRAHDRGIDVKLVTEKDTFSGETITGILEAGIQVVADTGTGLMHNKFAVIDGSSVFTGSYNTTDNCTFKNNNNAVLIRSAELAAIYCSEFHEMFDSGIFGNKSEEGAFAGLFKRYYVKLEDMDINVYFAPEDNVEKIIHDRLEKAEKSVKFMQFSFTSDIIGEVMIKKFQQGVAVAGVFEKNGSDSEYSEYTKMKIEGVPVRLDKNKNIMHHKVIIIDDCRVITGSFNISKNANSRNDENILIIDSRNVASKYTEEFRRIYGGAADNE